MKFVSASALCQHESRCIAASPNRELEMQLIRQAGNLLASQLMDLLREGPHSSPSTGILFFVGKGNNGADARAAAVILHQRGIRIHILSIGLPSPSTGNAAADLAGETDKLGIPKTCLDTPEDWQMPNPIPDANSYGIWVDALLGTGTHGEPQGVVAAAIDFMNTRSPATTLLSVDIPSGLDPENGTPSAHTVRADYTLCMAYPKSALTVPSARDVTGTVRVGRMRALESEDIPPSPFNIRFLAATEVASWMPLRPRASHKGNYGRVLLLGGCELYPGALVLAAEGATRSGAGIVRASTTPPAVSAILARTPEVIARPDLYGEMDLNRVSAILCGPGLGRDAEARRIVAHLIHETPVPLVLDADALTVLGDKTEPLRECPQPLLLTPHAGELAILLGCTVEGVQCDRPAAVAEAARRTGAIVILKGDATLLAREGEPIWMNLNGNPGMATGGSGDVLAGLLAGLLAQGMSPWNAARAAVYLHGAAGDLAALRLSTPSLRTSDLITYLPAAFRTLPSP